MSIGFFIFLFLLYAIQGIPYGIQSRFIPVYLRSKSYSLTVLGLLKLLYIPWVLKTLYAPMIELKWTRLGWLKLSVFLLFIVSLVLSQISETSKYLIICLFCMNFFCASQDIALDGIMLSQLSSEDLSLGNVAQVVGYKCGAVVGGGVLLFLSYYFSWKTLFLFIATLYITAFLSLFVFSYKVKTNKSTCVWDHCNIVIKNILTRSTMTILGLSLFYKLGEQGALNLIPLFLYDKGFVIKDIGFWTGIVGQITSVLGSSLATVFIRKIGLWGTLFWLSILSLPIHGLMVFFVQSTENQFFLAIILMNSLLFISGVRTTTVFSLMMSCSQLAPNTVQSTHYTFLATVEVVGKLLFSSIVGWIADVYGYTFCYCVFWFLALLLLGFLVKNKTILLSIEHNKSKSVA